MKFQKKIFTILYKIWSILFVYYFINIYYILTQIEECNEYYYRYIHINAYGFLIYTILEYTTNKFIFDESRFTFGKLIPANFLFVLLCSTNIYILFYYYKYNMIFCNNKMYQNSLAITGIIVGLSSLLLSIK